MRKLVAVLALVFFFLPTALWIVGARARPFENRRMAGIPHASEGWSAFDATTRFFVDRLPLREQAVRANTWTSVHVFDTTPDYSRGTAGGNPARDALPFGEPVQPKKPKAVERTQAGGKGVGVQPGVTVMDGRDGWLFLEDELGRACQYFISWPGAMRRWERMVSIIRASGRRVVLAVPPDKSTIYPEFLPDVYKEKDCLPEGRKLVWSTLEATRDPDILPLRKTMLAGKAAPPQESYYPLDTHWNTKGAVQAVRAVLAALGGKAQMTDAEIVKGRTKYTGDLSVLRGAPEQGESPAWSIQRPVALPGDAKEGLPAGAQLDVLTRAAGGAPLIAGRTLFLYDSFGVGMLGALAPYTREFASVLWFETPPADLIDAIAGAHTVILEHVERDMNYFASDQGVVTPKFLAQLAARLKRP